MNESAHKYVPMWCEDTVVKWSEIRFLMIRDPYYKKSAAPENRLGESNNFESAKLYWIKKKK